MIRLEVKRYGGKELNVDLMHQAYSRDKRDVSENRVTKLLVTQVTILNIFSLLALP
jgi:hypothetical protein